MSEFIIARQTARLFLVYRRKVENGRRFYVADVGKKGSYEHCLRLIYEAGQK